LRVSVVASGIDVDDAMLGQPRESRPVEAVARQQAAAQAAPRAAQAPEAPQERTEDVRMQEAPAASAPEPEYESAGEEETSFREVASAVADHVQSETEGRNDAYFDPKEFEAEVIIHKPGEAPRSLSEQKAPKRPYIPEGLDRVEGTAKDDMPSFLGQRPQPVPQSRTVKRAPSFFERLAGGRKSRQETENETPRREPVLGQGTPVRARATAAQPVISPDAVRDTETRREPVQQKRAVPSEEGLIQPSYEEDQLEIPTFLRRQAN
jgi:cell division protein FtsZ